MKIRRSLVYYITAHGYGHGVRSCDIIRALRRTDPDLDIRIVTDVPVDFLRSRLDLPMEAMRAGSFDVGMVQIDSVRVDVEKTRKALNSLMARRPELIRQECAFLRAVNAGLVVCDIPAIPMEAANAEHVPVLAVGNFAWDWIYEEFADQDPRWLAYVNLFREGYRKADLLLRLPFSEPMRIFARQENLPLVASPGCSRREDMARDYGMNPEKTWVLLSFSSLDWTPEALGRVQALDDYIFLTIRPLGWPGANFREIDRHAFPVSDIMATADLVVSKPGFGILSECAANNKTLVFVERTSFREYPILETAIKGHLRHHHIPARDLYAGNLAPHLDAALRVPPPNEAVTFGGDAMAARIMLKYLQA